MSTDITTTTFEPINEIQAGHVIYAREIVQTSDQPEFKPGNTPHTQFGEQMLNFNVPWDQIVFEILTCDYTLAALAEKIQSTTSVLNKILKQDFSTLNFRTGARILGVHSQLFPDTFA